MTPERTAYLESHTLSTSHTDTEWHAWCPTCGWRASCPVRTRLTPARLTETFRMLHDERSV